MAELYYEISVEYQGNNNYWDFHINDFYENSRPYYNRHTDLIDYRTAVYTFFKIIEIVKKKYPTYVKVILWRRLKNVGGGVNSILHHYHDFEFPQPSLFDDKEFSVVEKPTVPLFKKITNILKLTQE